MGPVDPVPLEKAAAEVKPIYEQLANGGRRRDVERW